MTSNVTMQGVNSLGYVRGKILTSLDVEDLVLLSINTNKLPFLDSGVYFLVTAPDVYQSDTLNISEGFCYDFCGWHFSSALEQNASGMWNTVTKYNAKTARYLKFAYVGDPSLCSSACVF